MIPTPNFSMDQLIAALRATPTFEDDGGFTTDELAEAIGLSNTQVRARLKHLMRDGVIGCKRVRRLSLDGRFVQHSVYFYKPPQ